MIPVTKPFLPPQEEFQLYVDGIWQRNWLTNNGPLVLKLEQSLRDYLDANNLLFLANGTIAIQIAIKALKLTGEIITTPFSYVATTSSLVWEGCTPVFVDVDESTLNLDATKIQAAITSNTQAILATHCYGNPCDIDAIQAIASKHGLKIIYDAAHCFGTKYKGQSVFTYGDISTTSFHATKLFHTVEGGAIFTQSTELLKEIGYMRNFGHDGPENFHGVGINGKNSELHAAFGLVNLNHIDSILERRKSLSAHYDSALKFTNCRKPGLTEKSEFNFAYYPLVLNSEQYLLPLLEKLHAKEIFPRRYFYPLLSNLPYVKKGQVPIADSVSKRVICLPLYHSLTTQEIDTIAQVINNH